MTQQIKMCEKSNTLSMLPASNGDPGNRIYETDGEVSSEALEIIRDAMTLRHVARKRIRRMSISQPQIHARARAPSQIGQNEGNGDSIISLRVCSEVELQWRLHQLKELRSLFKSDPAAADIRISIFVAAANTHKYKTCVRPCPHWICRDGKVDITLLERLIENLPPSVNLIYDQLFNPSTPIISNEILRLLHWLLVDNISQPRQPVLRTLNDTEKVLILYNFLNSETMSDYPTHMFAVGASHSRVLEYWNSMEGTLSFRRKKGFLNISLEDVHAMLYNGLFLKRLPQSSEGVRLALQLSTARKSCSFGYTWGGTKLGRKLACIVVCEFDAKPKEYIVLEKGKSSSGKSANGLCDKYVDVQPESLDIRFLLFYSPEPSPEAPVGHFVLPGCRWKDFCPTHTCDNSLMSVNTWRNISCFVLSIITTILLLSVWRQTIRHDNMFIVPSRDSMLALDWW